MGKSTISMAIFNSKLSQITRGYIHGIQRHMGAGHLSPSFAGFQHAVLFVGLHGSIQRTHLVGTGCSPVDDQHAIWWLSHLPLWKIMDGVKVSWDGWTFPTVSGKSFRTCSSQHQPANSNISKMFHMIFPWNSHGNIMTYPHPMTNPSNLVQSNLWPWHQAESRRIPTSSDHMSPWLSILNCLKYNGGSSKP